MFFCLSQWETVQAFASSAPGCRAVGGTLPPTLPDPFIDDEDIPKHVIDAIVQDTDIKVQPSVQHDHLFKHFLNSIYVFSTSGHVPLSSLYPEAANLHSFEDVLSLAKTTFDPANVDARAMSAAALAPSIPSDTIVANSDTFLLDPIGTIETFNARSSGSRLCRGDIETSCSTTFPKRDLLLDIADGVHPIVSDLFSASLTAAKVRPRMSRIQPVINALVQVSCSKGEAFVVDKASFLAALVKHNLVGQLNEIHQTGKIDDDLGRLLFDYTNLSDGSPINSDDVLDKLRAVYGRMSNPTVAQMLVRFYRMKRCFPDKKLVWGKLDVHRAYNRLGWTPHAALLMSLLISDDLVMIPTGGGFGWMGQPYVYSIVSTYFQFRHRERVASLQIIDPATELPIEDFGDIYIDDEMLIATEELVSAELRASGACIIDTFSGDTGAIKDSKTVIGPREVILGVLADTESELAAPSFKAYLKLCFVFFHAIPFRIAVGTQLPLAAVQSIAQMSLRYSLYPLYITIPSSLIWLRPTPISGYTAMLPPLPKPSASTSPKSVGFHSFGLTHRPPTLSLLSSSWVPSSPFS